MCPNQYAALITTVFIVICAIPLIALGYVALKSLR